MTSERNITFRQHRSISSSATAGAGNIWRAGGNSNLKGLTEILSPNAKSQFYEELTPMEITKLRELNETLIDQLIDNKNDQESKQESRKLLEQIKNVAIKNPINFLSLLEWDRKIPKIKIAELIAVICFSFTEDTQDLQTQLKSKYSDHKDTTILKAFQNKQTVLLSQPIN